MNPHQTPRRRLETWKEIADFLGRGVRTVQRWERRNNLPVSREAGGQLERVFAWTDELEAWRNSLQGEAGLPPAPPAPPRPPAAVETPSIGKRRRALLAAAGAVAGLALGVFLAVPGATAPPADVQFFRILKADGNARRIEILDTDDRVQLSFFFKNFAFERKMGRAARLLDIQDLDADGLSDVVLYNPDRRRVQFHFREPGGGFRSEEWDVGLRYPFSGQVHRSFQVDNLLLEDLTGDGKPEFILVQVHIPYFLSCCRVFGLDQKEILTLWHPGHLHRALFADRDRDGRKELYLDGTNNFLHPYSAPVCIALDCDWTRRGQAIHFAREDRAMLPAAPTGMRVVYINLQKDEVNPEVPEYETSQLWPVRFAPEEFVLIVGASPLRPAVRNAIPNLGDVTMREFHFNRRMECILSRWTPGLVQKFGRDPSQPRLQALLRPRYWNGSAWQDAACEIPRETEAPESKRVADP